ncbi:MAG TPA: Fic family protein [Solirubrobacteraceae bacterium]|nr:Fic family protein [Solirubrobacteraceae bacterium]
MPVETSDQGSIELYAAFKRYQPDAVARLSRIERALGAIRAAPVIPPAANQMRASALAGTVHYSPLIEGNELPLIEAERAAARELDATTAAKIELVNYVEALAWIDERDGAGELEITPEFLLGLHGVLMRGLGREDSDFKPHHEGAWRDGRALILNELRQIVHEGSPPEEVPLRMAGLCEWVTAREQRLEEFPPPVLAAVAHYAITDIHPFANGNGRTARLVSSAILQRHGYLPGQLFCFDRYYARDKTAYLAALRSVKNLSRNMENWLVYYLEGLAEEYERVQAEVEQLAQLGLSGQSSVQLKASEQKALSALAVQGVREFTRADYQHAAGVSQSTAIADLNDLVAKRIVRRLRRGATTAYAFARASDDRRGRPRDWTPERIESELAQLCEGRTQWPTIREFDAAGKRALYLAVGRYGGVDYWAERMGLSRRP